MADTDNQDDEEQKSEPKKKGGKRKLIVFIGLPVLVIILVIVVAFVLGLGPFGSSEEEEVAQENGDGKPVEVAELPPTFYELPEMRVNLNTDSNSLTYLKIKVSLELATETPEKMEENKAKLEALMPRVIDNLQVYMRELRIEDINGSAGMFRLKQEMLARVNRAVRPVGVRDILFSDFVIE